MWPYYDQNPDAPFLYVFEQIGWIEIKWIVAIGAIFALCTSLLGAMFPLPRVLYAMGSDGVIYKFFQRVNPTTRTPLIATILSGFLAAVMALIFNLHQLIDMMSIGTLMAYTIVAICVLVLHYEAPNANEENNSEPNRSILRHIVNIKWSTKPNRLTSAITKVGIVFYSILAIILCSIILFDITNTTIYALIIIATAMLLTILVIYRQPKNNVNDLTFKVPMVPFLPYLSIFINIYLMFQLDRNTWIRFGVWLAIGELNIFLVVKSSK